MTTAVAPATTWPTLPDGRYAVLRTNRPDGASQHGFVWPHEVGSTATAPDWDPSPRRDCGGGLHGLLWGCGDVGLPHHLDSADTVWLVLAVELADIATPIGDGTPSKVRFRSAEIIHVGDQVSAPAFLWCSARRRRAHAARRRRATSARRRRAHASTDAASVKSTASHSCPTRPTAWSTGSFRRCRHDTSGHGHRTPCDRRTLRPDHRQRSTRAVGPADRCSVRPARTRRT